MRRVILSVAALAVLSVCFASSVQAASPIQIRKIYFNSPGTDTRTITSLNAEYVVLRNVSSTNRSLYGWTVRDAASHIYRFGSYTLRAGYSVYVHTGRGTNTATHRYWGSGNYIWNNTGDKATLKNSAGTTMDTCSYSGSGSYVYC
jgi:lamin tail-like protein